MQIWANLNLTLGQLHKEVIDIKNPDDQEEGASEYSDIE